VNCRLPGKTPPRRLLPVIEHTKELYRLWLPVRRNMARDERFGLGKKIDELLLELLEMLRNAMYANIHQKLTVLGEATSKIDSIRFFMQLAWETKIIQSKQFENISPSIEEIGRMIGGWRKGLLAKTPPPGK
jgi:hypothetical protein